MTARPESEWMALRRTEDEVKMLRAVIDIARIVQPFTCGERQEIERKVKEIIR